MQFDEIYNYYDFNSLASKLLYSNYFRYSKSDWQMHKDKYFFTQSASLEEGSKIESEEKSCSPCEHKVFAKDISIYPNPVNLSFTIEFPSRMLPLEVSIFNIFGAKVDHFDNGSNKIIVDVSHYSKGLYIILIRTTEGILQKKIVVE